MKNYSRCFVVASATILLISIFIISCGKAPTNPDRTYPAPMMSIYDSVVIAKTNPVSGQKNGYFYKFDFTDELPAIKGKYDNLFMHYWNRDFYDNNHLIWDEDREAWDQYARRGDPLWLFMGREAGHSILGVGLTMREYIDDSSMVTIMSDVLPFMDTLIDEFFKVTAVKYHPGYRPTYLTYRDQYTLRQFAFDGESYWMKTDSNIITEMSTDGDVIEEHISPIRISNGFASIDNGFAYVRSYDRIIILDENLIQTCALTLPSGNLDGLAWGEGKLWAAYWYGQDHTTLLGIDLDSSCQIGEIVITDSIPTDYYLGAIAFDGTHLLACGGLLHPTWLYRIALSGEVLDSIVAPLADISDMQIHDGIIHVLGSGPPGLGCDEKLIARFRMDR